MSTPLSSIIADARGVLNATGDNHWTNAELLAHGIKGYRDLWRRINDLYQDYFSIIDSTNVTLAANTSQLSGVPATTYRVVSIEPRVLGASSPNQGLIFEPRPYNHPDMVNARACPAIAPTNQLIFYTLFSQGAPVAAPIIRLAPQVSSAVNLTLVYNTTLAALTESDPNPIPGESDAALMAWIVAYARAKENGGVPDAGWLQIYGTEKANLVAQLTPRQIQKSQVAEGLFEELWDGWN